MKDQADDRKDQMDDRKDQMGYPFPLQIQRKNIKNLYIRVVPPDGRVQISAPKRMPGHLIREAIEKRLPWIIAHRKKMLQKPPRPIHDYKTGDQVLFFGQTYLIQTIPGSRRDTVKRKGRCLLFPHWEGQTAEEAEKRLYRWYADRLQETAVPLLEKWQREIGVSITHLTIRKMKSRWGSCNVRDRRISLNLHLVKYPVQCLEYVIIHELVHLLEKGHNPVFWGYVEQYDPEWRKARSILNSEGIWG